jgi:AcrR family transcriptional regulator
MPKIANHEERRRDVCEAAWTVIARDGLEATSLRAIAFELGMTTGVLMHYFKDREELISFAIEEIMNRVTIRIDQLLEGKEGFDRIEAMLLAGLPIDDKNQRGWKIWLAVTGASVGKANLLAQHQARYATIRNRLVKELKSLQKNGLVSKPLNINLEADAMVELTDGIGVGWFIDPDRYSAHRQKAAVRRHIDCLRTA